VQSRCAESVQRLYKANVLLHSETGEGITNSEVSLYCVDVLGRWK